MTKAEPTKPGARKPHALRRQYIINPRFQWKFTGLAALGVFVVSIAMGVAVYLIQLRESQARILSPAWTHARENTLVIVLVAAAFALVMAAGFAVWSIFLTHRVCGPLYVVERCLDSLIEGKFPKQRPLRAKDEFIGFYGHFWRAVEAISSRKRADVNALSEIIRSVKTAADADPSQHKQHLESIEARLQTMLDEGSQSLGLVRDNTPARPSPAKGSPTTPTPQHAAAVS